MSYGPILKFSTSPNSVNMKISKDGIDNLRRFLQSDKFDKEIEDRGSGLFIFAFGLFTFKQTFIVNIIKVFEQILGRNLLNDVSNHGCVTQKGNINVLSILFRLLFLY